MSSPEGQKRWIDVQAKASLDGITPNELIQREIRGAVERKNPFLSASDPFVVLGFDGFDGSIFPVGSFKTPEEALEYEDMKRKEEHLYSKGPDSEIATTFKTYTADGILVNPSDKLD